MVVVVFISSVLSFLWAQCKRQFSVPFLSCSYSRVEQINDDDDDDDDGDEHVVLHRLFSAIKLEVIKSRES